MLAILTSLIFVLAAGLAAATLAATWLRYRAVVRASLAGLRGVAAERDFVVRIGGPGRHPALAGHPALRRAPHRAASRRRPALLPPALLLPALPTVARRAAA